MKFDLHFYEFSRISRMQLLRIADRNIFQERINQKLNAEESRSRLKRRKEGAWPSRAKTSWWEASTAQRCKRNRSA
ncbi:unnamed protein product [Oikopleura dioica]|uniref:Uncharacterized protein n=1 Tax=Oikopleura dioica TaxID=34765 RepID=E4YHY0_OIKDI|nr:unnamed protein product [Oikopleura dioica]